MDVRVIVIYGEGLNSEEELALAFERAGAVVDLVHIQDVIDGLFKLSNYHILGVPGGFSYGDHLGSGKIFSNVMLKHFKTQLNEFLKEGKLVLGICNGFQILVKMGLLPFAELGNQSISLSFNESLRYENRWVKIKVNEKNPSIWLKNIDTLNITVRHGEGRIVFKDDVVKDKMLKNGLNALAYVDENNVVTQEYPKNPNGSPLGIAGVCDPSGQVLGLMPHPEVNQFKENAPAWKTQNLTSSKVSALLKPGDGECMSIFYNGVNYVKENLLSK